MRTSYDVRRSINRYLALFLPDEWDVRMAENEAVWERPSALIQTSGPQVIANRVQYLDITRPFTIYAYPIKRKNIEDSDLEAQSAEDLINQAFSFGGHGGYPLRVPLYNYDGITLAEPLPDDAEIDGYVQIIDFNVDTTPDTDDQRLYTIIASFRAKWSRLAPDAQPSGEIAESVTAHLQIPLP